LPDREQEQLLPTVLRADGFRFYFYSHEPGEPPHVHVDKGGASAKVWLDPVAGARNRGFRPSDLNAIFCVVRDHRSALLEAWNGYFGESR
jgi:hypothetical protein